MSRNDRSRYISVTAETHATFCAVARRRGVSVRHLVTTAIEQLLDRLEAPQSASATDTARSL